MTTIMTKKNLMKGAPAKMIFEEDLGEICLEKLGAALEQEDWDEGSVMSGYFQIIEARGLELAPWVEAVTTENIKGRLRSAEFIMPLPQKPMCPKESRVQQTHVVVDEDKVVLEQVSMTLDVPVVGTSFNAVICDTFTVSEGRMKMQRTFAIEWVKSSWLTSTVEREGPGGAAESSPFMVKAIKNWWESA